MFLQSHLTKILALQEGLCTSCQNCDDFKNSIRSMVLLPIVSIGSRGILKKYPDVVSGINFGSNMVDDVVYSGTVGAAIEGRHAKLEVYDFY